MNTNFQIWILCLFCVLEAQYNVGQAQNGGMKFAHLTVDNGLSSNRIWCIYRDSKDYLWMATDAGLDKFDSYQIKKYRYDENLPGSISSNHVRYIYEDREKKLWIGTSNGLNLYDPAKDNFSVFKNNPADKNSINSNYISSIIEDTKGNLWMVSDGNCLNKWVPNTRGFVKFLFETKKKDLADMPTRMIANDSKGYLWIVTLNRGIYRFSPESGTFTKYDDPSVDFGSNCFKSLYIDDQDKIWITTIGNGFFSYDPVTDKFEHFGSKGDGNGTNQNLILDIIPEDTSHLLLAVDQGGINRFNKVSKTFEYIMYDNTNNEGLNNNGIWCFHKDRQGILWVGTSGGGINYYNPKREKFNLFKHNSNSSKSLSYSFVGCFYEDHQGLIWIGTDGGGVNVYDPEKGNFVVFKYKPSDPYSISGDVIRCISEDKNHDIWIGTWDAGLNRYDRKTGRFFHYMPEKNNPASMSGKTIWNLKVDQNDIIWLAVHNIGIDLFDKRKGVIKRFRSNPDTSNGISSNVIWFFFEDAEKNMWICTSNGLNRYDYETNSFKVYNFADNTIGAFCRDREGNLWVGTETKGIYYCRPDGTIIKTYDVTNGLPSNSIQAIIEDNSGNLWFSSNNGISRFDVKTQKFRNYFKEDGLQGDQFFAQSFLKTSKGEIYFGGFNGFNSFYPDSLKDNDFLPPVYLTDFQIFNKPVPVGIPGSQFQTHISEAKEIKLSWRQSVFSFSFAAINYTYPERNLYAYKMEGFEKDWNYTDATRRYVTYTNLDPGKYTFKVKASNNDDVWNEKGVALNIIILPPWWKTLWFKAIGLIAFILTLIIAYYLRLEIYREREKELSELVEKRTREITLANDQLVQKQNYIKLQTDTIQETNIKLTKLNTTKDRILSIIGHDLRNPFNVVSGFSELLLEDYRTLPPETIEMYLNQISNSSKNGNILLGNLLQWSRTQTGGITFEPVRLNLFSVAEEIYDFLEGDALKKKISIQLQIDPDVYVEADENMLKTILRNLLSNAIKFTHNNGIIAIFSTLKSGYVEVCVSDSGVGIPKDKIPLLFKTETNTSTQGTSQESGTGLGLILCKEFVEKHHGKIWVETKVGIGSQFKFSLPLK